MRILANISVTLTTLILLAFGSGGVGLMTCGCSGKTTLAVPLEQDCCPEEGNCMTVTVLQLSDSDLTTSQLSLQLPPCAPCVWEWQPIIGEIVCRHEARHTATGYPPPKLAITTVLRV